MSPRASIKALYLGAIRYAASHNLPRLAALLMLPNLRTLKAAKASDARTLVVLTKEGVTADVMTALAGADEVKVVALPRIIVALLECNQLADGSVKVPSCLLKYMDGQELIKN